MEKIRQVPLAKGQSQQQRVNRENEIGQSRAGLGKEGHWVTGQGGASRASLRSRAKQMRWGCRQGEREGGGRKNRKVSLGQDEDGGLEAIPEKILKKLLEMRWAGSSSEKLALLKDVPGTWAQEESVRKRLSAEGVGARLSSGIHRGESWRDRQKLQ